MTSNIDNTDDTISIDLATMSQANIPPLLTTTGFDYTFSGTNGISGIDWSASNLTWSNTQNTIDVKGDANFEGDIKVKGKSIVDSLERIEERLAILRPNDELEEKWEKLRGLRQAYMELEAEIIEKEKIWAILKK